MSAGDWKIGRLAATSIKFVCHNSFASFDVHGSPHRFADELEQTINRAKAGIHQELSLEKLFRMNTLDGSQCPKPMRTTVAFAALLFGSVAVSDLLAQGMFQWGNAMPGLLAPIYGPDPNCPIDLRRGNTASGIPAGTQTYGGPLLGSGYTAGIYVGLTASEVMAQNQTPRLNGTAVFRNTVAGDPTGRLATGGFTAVADAIPAGTLNVHYQLRVWDNRNGTVTSWTQVMAAGGTVGGGMSEVYVFSEPLAANGMMPPATTGIRSFNIASLGGVCVPEPRLIALAVLSLGALLLHRRK